MVANCRLAASVHSWDGVLPMPLTCFIRMRSRGQSPSGPREDVIRRLRAVKPEDSSKPNGAARDGRPYRLYSDARQLVVPVEREAYGSLPQFPPAGSGLQT